MAVFNEPTKWQTSLVNSGDANTIPQNTPAGTGEASFEEGFPQITQIPLSAGGQAPDRKDFNGLFKVLGDWIFFNQNGGVSTYSENFDYVAGRVVLYNDNIYKCIQANGASSTVVAPDSVSPLGTDYWSLVITSEMINAFATIALDNTTNDSIYNLQNSTNDSEKLVALHNNIFRGDNLLNYFDDISSIKTAVASGDFSKIFVGDYIPATITYNGTQYTTNYRVAGIDLYMNRGSTPLTKHHLVIVPDDIGITSYMNSTNTVNGAYVGSYMHTTFLPALYNALAGSSGDPFYGCILSNYEILTYSVDSSAISSGVTNKTGIANASQEYATNLVLMSEMEVYSAPVYSSSAFDTSSYQQLPLFRLKPIFISQFNIKPWWLRSMWSNQGFCVVGSQGHSAFNDSATNLYVRPRFLFG